MTENLSETDGAIDVDHGVEDPEDVTAQGAPVNVNLEHIAGPPVRGPPEGEFVTVEAYKRDIARCGAFA